MAIPKIYLSPLISGYAYNIDSGIIATKLDGGLSRYRFDKLNQASIASVKYVLDSTSYNYLMAFINTKIAGGSLPFTCNLQINSNELTSYEAKIIPNSIKVSQSSDAVFNVDMQMEIKPVARDEDADNILMLIFESGYTDAELSSLFVDLEEFANVTLPTDLAP